MIFVKKIRYYIIIGIAVFLATTVSCRNIGNRPINETPTRGNIKISVDESFQPLLETEIFTFTTLYPNAFITAEYKTEFDVMEDFMNDSVKVVVSSRRLTENQVQYLRERQIVARTITFAHDAIALVAHRDNPDTILTYNTVRDIFLGRITNWNQINPNSNLGEIRVIFESSRSGNVRYFRERFNIEGSLSSNFFSVNANNFEVIDFVSRNRNTIGIVSVNWISNTHDRLGMSYLRSVNLIAVSNPALGDALFFRPHQGSIYDRTYPFTRDIHFISRETFAGLGTGFIQWVTAEQGQRIVLRSGLVPATMPPRNVHIMR